MIPQRLAQGLNLDGSLLGFLQCLLQACSRLDGDHVHQLCQCLLLVIDQQGSIIQEGLE